VTGPVVRAWRHPAGRLIILFTLVSLAIFGIPAAFGSTWLVGDNLIQNFPLRVLVGIDLRHGHLPLWDPYLWSGAPLLAGFNAGAAYPATWLFGVLPGALAWVMNQVTVAVVASAGMLALLRVLGRSWLAAGLGAAAFAFGGFMTAQSVHLDLVQAAAWLPWAFVAVDRLAHRAPDRSAAPWVALLGGSVGLMILSGAVEPILDGGIVLALYCVWLAWRTPGRRRLEVIVGSAAGLVLGLAAGAAQLLPGAAFQAQSQRAMHSFSYFASGSMNKSLTILGLDPFLLGGIHSYPLNYLGTFNLPEISSYVGILPVMGLVGLLARRHRRSPEAGQWWIWYAIAVVGLFLTWGGFTPVAHLAYDIPLFNRQRLLNRNLLEVDLAVAVLFAAWVDRMFTPAIAADTTTTGSPVPSDPPGAPGPAPPRRWWPTGWTSDVVLPLVPPLAVVGLQIVLLAGGPWFPHLLHVPGTVTRARLWPLIEVLSIPSVIALGAGFLVVRRARLGRRLPALLVTLLVVDLVIFNVGIQGIPNRHGANTSSSALADRLARLLAAQGQGPAGGLHRVAMFDPDRYYPLPANDLGQPDLTLLRSIDSVQGYGAVVDETYDAETGSHLQLNLTPAALSGSTFAQLDLGLLVSVPEYFVHLVSRPPGFTGSTGAGATALPPVPPDPAAPPDLSMPGPTSLGDYLYAPPPSPTALLTDGRARTQYFGTVLSVTAVTVPLPSTTETGTLRVGLLSSDAKTVSWLGSPVPVAGRSAVTVAGAAGGRAASGIVLLATAPGSATLSVGEALVRTAGQGTYRVDGSLRDVVTSPRWRFVGMDGVFCVFAQPSADGRAWVDGGAPGAARVVTDTPWGDETIRVTTSRSATLVRSVQFASGWQATITATGPPARRAASARPALVHRTGLLQSVTVPAGVHLVSFTYRPHRAYEGLAVSALAVMAMALLAGGPALLRRRRGRQPRPVTGPPRD